MRITLGNKTALVFGATGLVGNHCLDELLESPIYDKVLVFGRRTVGREHPKLVEHLINFEQPATYLHLIKGDDLFCCLGTTLRKAGSKEAFRRIDYTIPLQIAKAAAHQRVNQFLLVSAVGADVDSRFFYSRVKGELEASLRTLPFWAIHIFQPSVLLGKRKEQRLGETLAGTVGKWLGPLLDKYRPIEAATVAKAMLKAAQGMESGPHTYLSNDMYTTSRQDVSLL
jgi:uncharacterized protein YbjT (DUF2867 family)